MKKKSFLLQAIMWMLQGLLVGIGVILPGVSGGSLLYAFGIYSQILEVLANPIKGIKKYFKLLCFVAIGGAVGFIGFAGITSALLDWNEAVVISVFIGLIVGTLPGLWRDAGQKGRGVGSVTALVLSFAGILVLFYVFENVFTVSVPQNLVGWIVCGLIWGLGFVVPGLASSNLLMFFGIYDVLLGHIKSLELGVLIPFGLSVLAVFLLLSKGVAFIFDRYHSVMSHCIIGFVAATTVMILPDFSKAEATDIVIYILCIVLGTVASLGFTKFSDKVRAAAE